MGLTPNIQTKKTFTLKQCSHCKSSFGPEGFTPTKSWFYPDGALPICDDCITKFLEEHEYDWKYVNKLCQMVDVPFIPKEFERIHELNDVNCFHKYAEIFLGTEYNDIGWHDYYEQYCKLKEKNKLENELPEINEAAREAQKKRWGYNYDDEALDYLDHLLNGLMTTQNVNGDLQVDQAKKICKLSYEIDCKIREGTDVDKALASYEKLIKAAEFTPKNVKNINDFDSCGELVKWLEKRGWHNPYYDGATRDVVDETIKNIQAFNQRLYTNETGIGDEITRRIEALRNVKNYENYYETDITTDFDKFNNDHYNELLNDEFEADPEEDGGDGNE